MISTPPSPRLLILDRDGILNLSSADPSSPFYYILSRSHLLLKPNVLLACSILRILQDSLNLKIVIATKQRAVSKGLLHSGELHAINADLINQMGLKPPPKVYVEIERGDKANLFAMIIEHNPEIAPEAMLLVDDSPIECAVAQQFGIRTVQTGSLYVAVCEAFGILP